MAHFTRAHVGVCGTKFGTVRSGGQCVSYTAVRHTTHIITLRTFEIEYVSAPVPSFYGVSVTEYTLSNAEVSGPIVYYFHGLGVPIPWTSSYSSGKSVGTGEVPVFAFHFNNQVS